MQRKSRFTTYRIVFLGLMAAIVYVVTFFRFPLLGSKVHFANAMCLIAGMLFGGFYGGLAAGIGSALYDGLSGGYDLANVMITLVSKFLMAYICGKIAYSGKSRADNHGKNIAACIVGAWSYVALYMLKTFIYQRFVYGFPLDTTWATMMTKLPASAINALFAMIAAPLLISAIRPALKRAGVLEKLME